MYHSKVGQSSYDIMLYKYIIILIAVRAGKNNIISLLLMFIYIPIITL